MFRRQEDTMPKDPVYEANLKKLGYFINRKGCICNISAPDQFFDYYHTNNDRHNEVRGEAMRTCQREEVLKRLSALGITELYLPQLVREKPNGPHIPILAPPASVLRTRKRVIVIINDNCHQDLGILAYRELQREAGLDGGSVVNFAKKMIRRKDPTGFPETNGLTTNSAAEAVEENIPGLLVLNTGQLLYSHELNKAMSLRSWLARPKKSITHGPLVTHPENHVVGHTTPQEHIISVLDSVIKNQDFVAPDAEVYVVAIENGTEKLIDVLAHDFWPFGQRITAMAMVNSLVNNNQICNSALKAFLHTRTRQWALGPVRDPKQCTSLPSDYEPVEYRVAGSHKSSFWLETREGHDNKDNSNRFLKSVYYFRSQQVPTPEDPQFFETDPICPTFGGGSAEVGECIFTQFAVQDAVLSFFEEVSKDTKNYCNPRSLLPIVPEPTPQDPFPLSSSDGPAPELPPEMLDSKNQSLIEARTALEHMEEALACVPDSDPALEAGKQGLIRRIAKKRAEVDQLGEGLPTAGVGQDEAQELRQQWEPKTSGEKWTEEKKGEAVQFAGVQVDSELLKGAGCLSLAEESLATSEEGPDERD